MTEEPQDEVRHRAQGSVSLYAAAFLVLVGAGVALAASVSGFLASTRLLWASAALSGLAIVLAVLAVALPRR